jgi:hypothetical protein
LGGVRALPFHPGGNDFVRADAPRGRATHIGSRTFELYLQQTCFDHCTMGASMDRCRSDSLRRYGFLEIPSAQPGSLPFDFAGGRMKAHETPAGEGEPAAVGLPGLSWLCHWLGSRPDTQHGQGGPKTALRTPQVTSQEIVALSENRLLCQRQPLRISPRPSPLNSIYRLYNCSSKIRWESRSYDTAAISAKAKDFANFCGPAAQQLLRQRLR